MKSYELEMAVGIIAAAKLAIMKAKLQESLAVTVQTLDFDGAVPSIGVLDICPICGTPHYEGAMHS